MPLQVTSAATASRDKVITRASQVTTIVDKIEREIQRVIVEGGGQACTYDFDVHEDKHADEIVGAYSLAGWVVRYERSCICLRLPAPE